MSNGRSIFITATDTGVGKTMVSGLLLQFLTSRSINCGYQKWASSGSAEAPADLESCLQRADITPDPDLLDLQVPYRFDFPASPHLAAELAGEEIDPDRIIKAYRQMCDRYEYLIVEGVGGLLVPLRRDLLLADLLARLQIPTMIVARSGLGTLNHTLLTIEALRSRQIEIAGVVCTDRENDDDILMQDNLRTIAEIGQVNLLGRLPFCHDQKDLRKAFTPIGDKLFGNCLK